MRRVFGCAARCFVSCSLVLIAVVVLCASAAAQTCSLRQVRRDELVRAMSVDGDYDILATTNRGRFTAGLLLRLARWAKERDPEGGPLYITPEDWFFSYIQVAGVSMLDAPRPALLGLEHGQRVLIEYREDRVIGQVHEGPQPLLAVNIRAWWPEGPSSPSSFSFTDTTAVPKLKATSHREITYRLLEFDDMIVLDQIEGLSGRPVSGVLGALFAVIGEGSLKHSRIAIADDGLQLLRGRAKKIFSVSTTVTVEPDGRGTKGIPAERPDLAELERKLKRPLKIEYVPYAWELLRQECFRVSLLDASPGSLAGTPGVNEHLAADPDRGWSTPRTR
ncbi:MAG: hypothetical protein JSW46_01145 [Gemmatimonadota bacterium]|nr:MAG: hypothetical protein JSW46_01145 [Gemmatimonadota bacterium]